MKKLNKLIAIVISLAVLAMMCAVTAFAAPYAEGVGPIALTKTFTMPAGTTTPDVDFTFTFTQDTTNGNATAAAVGPLTISFDGEEGEVDANGTKTVQKTILDVFEDVTFTAPGLYIYDVYESAGGTNVAASETNKYTETYDNSEAHYKVQIAVDNTGTITAAVVQQTVTDDGDEIDEEDLEKVDPTYPGDEEDDDDDGIVEDETDASDFAFANNYEKKVTNTPTGTEDDEDGEEDGDSLYVEKLVTAPEGYVDDNQEFEFTIDVTFPAASSTAAYTAVVVNAAGTAVTPAQTLTFTRSDADSLQQTFTLKNGERLVFTSIDIGAKYKVVETANPDYNIAYSNTANTTATLVVDSADNGTKVTNDYNKDVTPTGILISNLPYIALALVAIGGLVAYVVVRRRQDDEA